MHLFRHLLLFVVALLEMSSSTHSLSTPFTLSVQADTKTRKIYKKTRSTLAQSLIGKRKGCLLVQLSTGFLGGGRASVQSPLIGVAIVQERRAVAKLRQYCHELLCAESALLMTTESIFFISGESERALMIVSKW